MAPRRRARPDPVDGALPAAVGARGAPRMQHFPARLLVALAGGQRAAAGLRASPRRSRVRARLPAGTAAAGAEPGAVALPMNAIPARRPRTLRPPAGTAPALAVLVFGLLVVALRPPLPIDETRYLEVFRESLHGSPLLLRLLGVPYTEKPPLLFWLARALTWLAVPPDLALRCLPPLALGATVLVVDRLGRRVGLTITGWLQAALWMGSLNGQFLH